MKFYNGKKFVLIYCLMFALAAKHDMAVLVRQLLDAQPVPVPPGFPAAADPLLADISCFVCQDAHLTHFFGRCGHCGPCDDCRAALLALRLAQDGYRGVRCPMCDMDTPEEEIKRLYLIQ